MKFWSCGTTKLSLSADDVSWSDRYPEQSEQQAKETEEGEFSPLSELGVVFGFIKYKM